MGGSRIRVDGARLGHFECTSPAVAREPSWEQPSLQQARILRLGTEGFGEVLRAALRKSYCTSTFAVQLGARLIRCEVCRIAVTEEIH
jgi:hypothetical protein